MREAKGRNFVKRIALAVLVAATVAPGCGFQPHLPAGTSYLPADAAFVLALDIPSLAATDLYKELQERGGAVGLNRLNFFKFAEMTGVDPMKDVKWLTFLGRGGNTEGLAIDQLSAVVSGSFDGGKVEGFLRDSGVPFETHEGLDIFQIVIVEGRCRFCIAVLDDTTAAFGDGETLEAMAESRRNQESSLASEPGARRLLTRVDQRAAIWGLARGKNFAAPFAELLRAMAGAGTTEATLGQIQDLSFFIAPGNVIRVAVDAVAANADDALLVADILEGAGAMGRLALRQAKPEAAQLLTTFKVEVDGQFLRASTSFEQASLVELLGRMADQVFGGMGINPFMMRPGDAWRNTPPPPPLPPPPPDAD